LLVGLGLGACAKSREAQEPPLTPAPLVSVDVPAPSTSAPDAADPAEPAGGSARVKLGEVVIPPPRAGAPQVEARALIWNARPDESLALAVRFGRPPDTTQAAKSQEPRGFGDSDARLTTLRVKLTDPTGSVRTRSARFPKDPRSRALTFWPGRTLFFDVEDAGVRIKWPGPLSAPWAEGSIGAKAAGQWRVAVTAEIELPSTSETLVATSGQVPFDVRPPHPKRAALLAAAEPARKKAGASNKHESSVEGGFVANTLIQLDDDRYVARFAKPAIWAFALTSVELSKNARVRKVETIDISTCIAETTRIATPEGDRAVETLRVGDVVWGWSRVQGARVPTRVRQILAYPHRPTVRLGRLQLSPNHPVWFGDAQRGAWRAAGELSQARPAPHATVYALTVDEPHTYFAEGVLVHNKDRMYSEQLDDPWVFMFDPKKEWWK
jgi:hypothetical protein